MDMERLALEGGGANIRLPREAPEVLGGLRADTELQLFDQNWQNVPQHVPMGPGPTVPVSEAQNSAYFGEVNLVTHSDVQQAVPHFSVGGIRDPGSSEWHKFRVRNKIVFWPKRPLKASPQVSWQAIYQAGLVYGVDDVGPDPYPVDRPVNQLRTITIGQHLFLIRLPTLAEYQNSIALMQSPSGLANLSNSDLYLSNTTGPMWCQVDDTTTSQGTGRTLTRVFGYQPYTRTFGVGQQGNAHRDGSKWHQNAHSNRPRNWTWRPFLELVR